MRRRCSIPSRTRPVLRLVETPAAVTAQAEEAADRFIAEMPRTADDRELKIAHTAYVCGWLESYEERIAR